MIFFHLREVARGIKQFRHRNDAHGKSLGLAKLAHPFPRSLDVSPLLPSRLVEQIDRLQRHALRQSILATRLPSLSAHASQSLSGFSTTSSSARVMVSFFVLVPR